MAGKTIRIGTWNVNGIRSVSGKGFAEWFKELKADVLCVQEIKAKPEQLTEAQLHPNKYHSLWHSAEKPGYSGVAIFSKDEPLNVETGIGSPEIDREGRVLSAEFKDFIVLSAYFPNSQRDHARLGYKLEFLKKIEQHLEVKRKSGKNIIICGDFNIAHKEIDLKNASANKRNAGFLPEERAWLDGLPSAVTSTHFVFSKKVPATIRGGAIAQESGQKISAGVSITPS